MSIFTSKEKSVIGFLGLSAAIGFSITQFKNSYVDQGTPPTIEEKEEFKALSDSIYHSVNHSDGLENSGDIETKEKGSKVGVEFVNINTANKDELTVLPKIGPVTAERIIHYRQDYGPFKSIDDLIKVKGIGPKTLDKIKERIVLRTE